MSKKTIEQKQERRIYMINFRASGTEEKPKLRGMAIVYNKRSEDLGGFTEIVSQGAATDAIKNSDARALFGHNSDTLLPLGRQSAGTLRATESSEGVEIEIDPPDTQFAKDLMHSIERNDIQDMSFGFTVADDSWETKDGLEIRTINKIGELFDFSFVTFPAYPDTSVAVRSLEKTKSIVTDSENGVTAENEDIEIDLLTNKVEDLI